MCTTFPVKAKYGSVSAEGDIKINGSVNTGSTPDVANGPGFYRARLWSWRELCQ